MSRESKAVSSKAPSQRQLRVGEEIRHQLSLALMRGDIYVPELDEGIYYGLRGLC